MPDSGPERPRLLFCSWHCLVDPSSGAALATRDLLALLAARGWPCAAFCGPQLDFEDSPDLGQLLDLHAIPYTVQHHQAGTASFTLFHFIHHSIPTSVFQPTGGAGSSPRTPTEGHAFLSLFDGVVARFQPDLLLTYGGHGLEAEIIARGKQRGLRVVFGLHNFAYHDATLFRGVDAVLVPSEYARDHYRRALRLESTALPYSWNWERIIRCPEVRGQYVTFVNPQPHKGVFWFARLAYELGQRRPDIPLLVVEGRGGADWLRQTGLDLSGLTNLHRMATTPDPRHFYRVSRAVLMPSLWQESFGRVAAEALLNGIPVLASRRGALPETLGQAGFLFDVPECYTPESQRVPTAAEVEPWLDTLIRLWDDAAFYERQRERCLTAAEAWRPERVLPRYEDFFRRVLGRQSVSQVRT
jgi:glycosyltransferase involved in cell wall biosynthesis